MKNFKLLIGHRGVGKTSLLKRLANYYPEDVFLDLDEEIRNASSKPIEQIFKNEKEVGFRLIEEKVFNQIIDEYKDLDIRVWLALGAGFNLDKISADVRSRCTLIWVARKTDELGRIFLDRPRLNDQKLPLVEFMDRYPARQRSYEIHHDSKYDMLEGLHAALSFPSSHLFNIEKKFFQSKYQLSDYGITLQKEDFLSPQRWRFLQREMLKKNFEFIELRDDLLSEDQILQCFSKIPENQVLFSFRNHDVALNSIKVLKKLEKELFAIDIEKSLLELLLPHFKTLKSLCPTLIISSHDNQPPWSALHLLNSQNKISYSEQDFHFKWSPMAENFEELQQNLEIIEDRTMSYLPRSTTGRWSWFRLWRSRKNRINFLNNGSPSALDQPTLFDVLANSRFLENFAGILGKPVSHSYSPAMHFDFFFSRQMSFHRIEVDEKEWAIAFSVLKSLGLKAAAVTSPLKIKAFESSIAREMALQLQSVNTLMEINNQDYGGWNTDGYGFSNEAQSLVGQNVMVWGGGGTKEMLKFYLPKAEMISARNPQLTEEHFAKKWVLIWASARTEKTKFPPQELVLVKIIDLNYVENSMGRELAQSRKVEYVSGLNMLIEQAREQQKIWQEIK